MVWHTLKNKISVAQEKRNSLNHAVIRTEHRSTHPYIFQWHYLNTIMSRLWAWSCFSDEGYLLNCIAFFWMQCTDESICLLRYHYMAFHWDEKEIIFILCCLIWWWYLGKCAADKNSRSHSLVELIFSLLASRQVKKPQLECVMMHADTELIQ